MSGGREERASGIGRLLGSWLLSTRCESFASSKGKSASAGCPFEMSHKLMAVKRAGLLITTILASLLPMAPAAAGTCDWDTSTGWVARENAQPGAKQWDLGAPVRRSADFSRRVQVKRIEGWFGATSAQCGQKVALHLVGGSKEYETTISIYRMGYYGGARARLVAVEKTVGDLWKFKVSQNTPPGQYLFRLDAPRHKTSFVPLVIRDAKSKSAITFISSVLTWQAYNQWGGSSLYKGPDAQRESRALLVTFNRPYDGDGAGQLRYMEFPALYLAEHAGREINYITDIDLDSDPTALRNTKSIVVGGHSEYWTERMRGAIDTSVDRGINFVSLGGNTAYNKVTYDPKTRTMSNAVQWRDPSVRKPESYLLGAQYFAMGVKSDYVVKSAAQWPFDVLKGGEKIVGVVGSEVDAPVINGKRVGVEILAASPPVGAKKISAVATYYTRDSGAGILNIGTNGWVCAIDNKCPWGYVFATKTREQIAAVTGAIFEGLTRGPLGKWRPAKIDIAAQP